jgi:drug/metabolite transporter (DMT)-like permease
LVVGATLLGFGGIFIVASGENTATTTFYRCLIALPVLIAMVVPEVRRHGWLGRRSTVAYLVGGAVLGVDFALWTHAVSLIGVGVGTLATNVHILVAPVLAMLSGRGRLGTAYLLTVPVMLVGVALAGNVFESSRSTLPISGLVFAVTAGIAYGVFVFLNGAVPVNRHVALPALLTTITCGIVGVVVGLAFGPVNTSLSATSLGWIACMAVTTQVLALIMIGPTLARVTASVGASLLLLTPILAVILGVLLFGEPLSPVQFVGVILVVGGVFMATIVAPRRVVVL